MVNLETFEGVLQVRARAALKVGEEAMTSMLTCQNLLFSKQNVKITYTPE